MLTKTAPPLKAERQNREKVFWASFNGVLGFPKSNEAEQKVSILG